MYLNTMFFAILESYSRHNFEQQPSDDDINRVQEKGVQRVIETFINTFIDTIGKKIFKKLILI